MSSNPPLLPPGTGVSPPERDVAPNERDHMHGWNVAIQNALANIGRAPGRYDMTLVLSAVIDIENPGSIIEYRAKLS